MKNLINAIATRKPVVVWNPFKANDTLTRVEFLSLIELSNYTTVIHEGSWIIAYQSGITCFGYETLQEHLQIAHSKQLPVYAAILGDEIELQAMTKFK